MTGQGEYCLDCYNRLILEKYGIDDTFDYPETMTVMELSGIMRTFHVEHMVLGYRVCWDAYEEDGDYHFRDISDADENGAEAAKRFFRKIVGGVCTKTLCESEIPAGNLLSRDGKTLSLRNKGTINIIEDKDRGCAVVFEIDGQKFTGEDLGFLLGAYPGFSLQYQIQDATTPVLEEDKYLIPVYITKDSLLGELEEIINICSDRGFLPYKAVSSFDEAFGGIAERLEVFARSEKRDDAIEAGKNMIRALIQVETDDNYFPAPEIQLICSIIDPYDTDDELAEILRAWMMDE